MKIRTRLLLTFILLVGLGFILFIRSISQELGPRYLAAMEESMVDTAVLLASLVELESEEMKPSTEDLGAVFDKAMEKRFSARIYELEKRQVGLSVYVTNARGLIVYHSADPGEVGEDYSRFNDVLLTLRGEYGARTTPSFPDAPGLAMLYVAAPVRQEGRIIGSLTVCKPAQSVSLFLATARVQIAWAGLLAALSVIVLGAAVSLWITRPIESLTRHVQALRDGRPSDPPGLGRGEIGRLGQAFEEMREKLEGKQYIEQYVQSLTHEMKSPLSSIRSAAELLSEEMAAEEKERFLKNILAETGRMQDLVDRLLGLSALEARSKPLNLEQVDLVALARGAAESLSALVSVSETKVEISGADHPVILCERFLVRQALVNLLKNAIEFSPSGSTITVRVQIDGGAAFISVEDQGPGIPDYAMDRIFERFYSLPRPESGKKSSGLGLAFVREVVRLHGGTASVSNLEAGGACAVIVLPLRGN